MRGRYSAALPVAADGDHPKLAVDAGGRLIASPGSFGGTVTPYDSNGDVTNLVVSAAAATLHSVYGYNNNVAARWVQFHDAAALPANGTLPSFVSIPVGAEEPFAWMYAKGWVAANGIVIAMSTTRATLTVVGAADLWVSGEYEV